MKVGPVGEGASGALARLEFPGPAGALEGVLELPAEGTELRGAAVVCHPHPLHGGTLKNTIVFRTARALRAAGVATLRFNFRGVGASEGEHDGAGGEELDVAAALDRLEVEGLGVPLWAAGYSFGARTVCRRAAVDERVRRVVLVALPARVYDCSCVRGLSVPGLLIFGSTDEFGTLSDFHTRIEGASALDALEVLEIDGADHFFRGRTPQLEEAVRNHALGALEGLP